MRRNTGKLFKCWGGDNMKRRIAFVTNKMVVGGVERALIALLDAIDYEKYEVTLWTKGIGGEFQTLMNPNVQRVAG